MELKSFPMNTEIEVTLHYKSSKPQSMFYTLPDSRSMLHRYHYSLSALPETGPGFVRAKVQQPDTLRDQAERLLDGGELARCGLGNLCSQFAGNLLERFRVEDLHGLTERTERYTNDPEFPLNLLQLTGLLQPAQRRDDGVEQMQQNQQAVLIEVELAVACPIALAANLMQSPQQRLHAGQVFQAGDISLIDLGARSPWHD